MSNTYTNALLSALPSMTIDQLRHKWQDVYSSEPPRFNRSYLEARLAYRLQELTFRTLSSESMERLRALRQEYPWAKSRRRTPRENKYYPPAGTILIREFRGREYRVRVLEEGFEYNGRVYKSLTRVARIIGAPWSGPRFFGLISHGT